MKRRQFLMSTAGAIGTGLFASPALDYGETPADAGARTYRILGVPLRAGSLLPGNENDAQAYREVQLSARLQAAGCKVVDDGDVAIPSYLPHHSIPPIRNWPAPRIAWECVRDRVALSLQQPNQTPLLIGCDCSVVIGTTEALIRASGQDVHVLYVDGDFDDAAPESSRCQSAASCAVWLLTHESTFWTGPPLRPSQVTVFGWSNPSRSKQPGLGSISLDDVRRSGAGEAARQALQAIPASDQILLHFDVDALRKQDLPAAYFPHAEGVSLSEAAEMLGVFLKDPRILDKQDTVAVAHWCDNGDSTLDLLPTSDIGQADTTLEHVLASTPAGPCKHDRTGELALQKTLQQIVDATRALAHDTVPVVIFLYGDFSAMPRGEADGFVEQLLGTSATVYGLRDHRSPGILGLQWLGGEQGSIANYMSTQTGGQYLWVTPETYAKGLGEILEQLHFRYELGFQPVVLDGKRHKLTVKLAGAGKSDHSGVRLRYRTAYVPVSH